LSGDNDSKARFREALEKRKLANKPSSKSKDGKSKIHGDQSTGRSPKIFRRKSGSS